MRTPSVLHFSNRWIMALWIGLCVVPAWGQSDPPGRVARLDYVEGAVTFSPAGDNEWTDAELNRPLVRGDRLWTDKGSRAEIQVGSSAVRMSGQTQLEVLALDDQSTQLSVTLGTAYIRVRSLPEGENFEIDTPNLAYRAAYPGDYRVDVDATGGTTRVTILSGTGAVYGEAGQSLPLGGGQQITFRGRSLAQVDKQESPPQDNFDRWAAERNRREDQSVSARYVPREVVGYLQLDSHGEWSQDATYGAVWFPQGIPADWAPYRDGHWEWIAPWGWTWIDDAPWAFAPSHYGRWAMIKSRWGWVPGRLGLRPIYAPALVAFIGGGSIPIAAGRAGVAWFPLGPGEAWQPGFKASATYVSNVNRDMSPLASTRYVHQNRPEALTVISAEDFHRGRPVRAGWLRIAANALTKAQVVPPPPMPDGRALASRERRPAIAQASAPSPGGVRQAAPGATAGASAQQRPATQAPRIEPANASAQAKLDQPKAAEQTKSSEQAKGVVQAREAERSKAEPQAKLTRQAVAAEHARLAQQQRAKAAERSKVFARAKRIEQGKAEETLKRERHAKRASPPSGHEQFAHRRGPAIRREASAKREAVAREEQARRAGASRRTAYARRDDKSRQDAHAQRVEQARRAAEREAESLRLQREQARREGQDFEQSQREVWDRYQQTVSEQWRREQAAEQQRQRNLQRPSLRGDRPAPPPEVWQRGIPILNRGPTS
jgi:hypothetical protein